MTFFALWVIELPLKVKICYDMKGGGWYLVKKINKKIIVVEQESGEILEEYSDGFVVMSESELQQKREYFKSQSMKDSQLKYQKKLERLYTINLYSIEDW